MGNGKVSFFEVFWDDVKIMGVKFLRNKCANSHDGRIILILSLRCEGTNRVEVHHGWVNHTARARARAQEFIDLILLIKC